MPPLRTKPARVIPASWARSTASVEGRDRGQDRHAGHPGLLHQLGGCPAADLEHAADQWESPGGQYPADDLVDGGVPADVLAQAQQLALGDEQPSRVQSTGPLEDGLTGAQPVRLVCQQGRPHPGRVVGHGPACCGADRVELSRTHRSGRCRSCARSRALYARGQCHVEHVVRRVRGDRRRSTGSRSPRRRRRPRPRRPATRSRGRVVAGVRMVTATPRPPTRISIGSSTADVGP